MAPSAARRSKAPAPKPCHPYKTLLPVLFQHPSGKSEAGDDDDDDDDDEPAFLSPCLLGWALGIDNDMKADAKELLQSYTASNKGWDFAALLVAPWPIEVVKGRCCLPRWLEASGKLQRVSPHAWLSPLQSTEPRSSMQSSRWATA